MTDDPDITAPRRAPDLRRTANRALLVGLAAVAVALVIPLFRHNWRHFFHGYLVAYLAWLGVTLGCVAVGLLGSVVGGRWAAVVRPIVAAGAKAVPLVAAFFLPLLLGLDKNYAWARPEWRADAVIRQQAKWQNVPLFVVRAVVYFAAWAGLAWVVAVWALGDDPGDSVSDDLPPGRDVRAFAGPGMIVFGVTVTFALIDWAMSVEPRWYSSVFGLSFVVGSTLAGLSVATVVVALLSEMPGAAGLVRPRDFGDLGNLILTFTLLWAYLAFSQFLIIWAGNLPQEVRYYVPRVRTGWRWVGLGLIVCHFAVPFFLLFSRAVKRSGRRLGGVALFVLVMRFVDWVWLIEPSVRWNFDQNLKFGSWFFMDLLLFVGLGGVWVAFVCRQMSGRIVLPPAVDEEHGREPAVARGSGGAHA